MSSSVKWMWIVSGFVSLGGFALIAYTVEVTESALPLWALILVALLAHRYLPTNIKEDSDSDDQNESEVESEGENINPTSKNTGED